MMVTVLPYIVADCIDIATKHRYNILKNKFKINLKIGTVRFAEIDIVNNFYRFFMDNLT